jgi:hypothetical protein
MGRAAAAIALFNGGELGLHPSKRFPIEPSGDRTPCLVGAVLP